MILLKDVTASLLFALSMDRQALAGAIVTPESWASLPEPGSTPLAGVIH